MLIRIVSMLAKVGQRSYVARANPGFYEDPDYDNDYGNNNSAKRIV
jgi:hypothetical protein